MVELWTFSKAINIDMYRHSSTQRVKRYTGILPLETPMSEAWTLESAAVVWSTYLVQACYWEGVAHEVGACDAIITTAVMLGEAEAETMP